MAPSGLVLGDHFPFPPYTVPLHISLRPSPLSETLFGSFLPGGSLPCLKTQFNAGKPSPNSLPKGDLTSGIIFYSPRQYVTVSWWSRSYLLVYDVPLLICAPPKTRLRIHWTSSWILILSSNYLWNHPIVSFYLWKLNSREVGDLLIIGKRANIRAPITHYAPPRITHLIRERVGMVEPGVTNPPFLAICLPFYSKSDCYTVLLAMSVFPNNKGFPVQNIYICG